MIMSSDKPNQPPASPKPTTPPNQTSTRSGGKPTPPPNRDLTESKNK